VVARGEVRWLELEEEGRRPVLVLTRDEALPRLRNIVVALVTRTVRGIETEVEAQRTECRLSVRSVSTT
jgi:mRNA interferase MazF